MLERMFGASSLPEPAALHAVGDAELIEAIEGWNRTAAAADARRLAAIAELARRRCSDEDDPRQFWVFDPTDAAACEVAAALNISHGRAIGQLRLSVLLRDRLPRINALFLVGSIAYKMVNTVMWRSLLADDEVLATLDAALAASVSDWGPLSDRKLEQKIDAIVEAHDPDAVRRLHDATRGRDVAFGQPGDSTGTTSMFARLLVTDAAVVKQRLDAMAAGVCQDDPRTMAQRRADALGALGAGADHLACLCGAPDCDANSGDGSASRFVVHIVADPSALTAPADPDLHGDDAPKPAAEAPERIAEPAPADRSLVRPAAGVLPGGAIVPPALLVELIRNGAPVQFVCDPGAEAEPRYAPSAKLAEYIRVRDLTCRFPGCDRPAFLADIDHTLPWPEGPTHPSDLKAYCRKHHLLKTFWSGDGGWSDRQLPDGTIMVTTPAGKTYTTKPGSALLGPGWNVTTGESPPTGYPPTAPDQTGLAMKRRKRTRSQDRERRIRAEREYNHAYNMATRAHAARAKATRAQLERAESAALDAWDSDPPPF
jgi:hypothetical protein